MAGTFDFCPGSRVVEELPGDEPTVQSMNGWAFAPKPKTPYAPSFKVTLYGLRWRFNEQGTALDQTPSPLTNAGRLRAFYVLNRLSGVFAFNHEYLGSILCRFSKPVTIPAAEPNSGGLIKPLEVILIQHNPPW